jgi:filamentous hemagglutinin
LIGGLGGGAFGAFGGAAGAAISSKLAPQTRAFANSVSDGTGSSLIGDIAGNALSGLAGAAVGGTAGAAGASNVNLYNQGHDTKESEAQKDIDDIHKKLDQERAMVGQFGAKAPQGEEAQSMTVPTNSLAARIAAIGSKVIIDAKVGG